MLNKTVMLLKRDSVKVGKDHLNSGNVKCWGYNGWGTLGDNTNNSSSIPVDVQNLSDVASVVSSDITNCALLNTGIVKCWGSGVALTAVELSKLAGQKFKTLYSGTGAMYCGVTTANQNSCFTATEGPYNGAYFPSFNNFIPTNFSMSFWEGGSFCSVKEQTSAYCWGSNTYGQLGKNSTAPVDWANQLNSNFLLMNTALPVTYVMVNDGRNYFLQNDNRVSVIGKKYNSLRGPSAVIKSPN